MAKTFRPDPKIAFGRMDGHHHHAARLLFYTVRLKIFGDGERVVIRRRLGNGGAGGEQVGGNQGKKQGPKH